METWGPHLEGELGDGDADVADEGAHFVIQDGFERDALLHVCQALLPQRRHLRLQRQRRAGRRPFLQK